MMLSVMVGMMMASLSARARRRGNVCDVLGLIIDCMLCVID